jgi:DNA-binding IclR family transcriptional regulator
LAATGETLISRVVRILAAFHGGEPSLSISEIARRSDLPVPTAHRLVSELVRCRLLERAPDRQIRVGLRLWELAVRSSPQLLLRDRALPFMEDLQAAVKQHTHLSVLDGTDLIYIERLSARSGAVNIARVAGRMPAAISSPGLVYAAFSAPEVHDAILAAIPKPLTAYTPTRRDQLTAAVAEVRRTGVAVANGWIHPDATGLAVAVRGADNEVLAALSLVVPRNSELVTTAVPALQATANGIARSLRTLDRMRDPELNLLDRLVQQGTTGKHAIGTPPGPAR